VLYSHISELIFLRVRIPFLFRRHGTLLSRPPLPPLSIQAFNVLGGFYMVAMIIGALAYRVPPHGWTPPTTASANQAAQANANGWVPQSGERRAWSEHALVKPHVERVLAECDASRLASRSLC
jgi:hypothetical protein